ncbi:DNA-binding response regulator [Serratia marcescens]|uniref:response regulator n=1 Tax=Serratia marcescens TaxID=615 RepID=UPI0009A496BF|nr:response regulator [Serratia marcescens]OPJ90683.1 DNA-binding response regulator [Serratia marcescens]
MRRRIVIADDHPVFLIGLRAVISSAFMEKFTISDEVVTVDQLLLSLEKEQPDILLTDFNMPGRQHSDGFRLIERLRRKYPSLPIVVVTVMSNPGLIKALLATGVYAVINKQSLTTELTLCLKSLLQGRQYTMSGTVATSVEVSPRELEVLRFLAQGKSINEIAAMLNRTKQTISGQKKSAMNKIGVTSTAELLEYLRTIGL